MPKYFSKNLNYERHTSYNTIILVHTFMGHKSDDYKISKSTHYYYNINAI